MFQGVLMHSETFLWVLTCSKRLLKVIKHFLTGWGVLRRFKVFSSLVPRPSIIREQGRPSIDCMRIRYDFRICYRKCIRKRTS